MDRVGFVGLGNMGRPMAAKIRRRQCPVAVFDLAPGPVAALVELGAEAAPDVAALARGADVVVTMGCGDECPYIAGKRYIDWDLPDPKGRPLDDVRATRDDIAGRVAELVAELDDDAR